jgi:hypothetical protein
MRSACVGITVFAAMASLLIGAEGPPPRGVLARPSRVTAEFVAAWREKGATAVVVMLDETNRREWPAVAARIAEAGMTAWPWIEVGRNRSLAKAHPEWMASIGGHHDDWRRRFPDAPPRRVGEVIKAWPWVPIGSVAAFEAHRARLEALLADLPGAWPGVFLNDLQAGPSSCGCGNDQCRWALDYGNPTTAAPLPDGDTAAARLVAGLAARHPGKVVVPVWVTECETIDLPDAAGGTGLCGGVGCARGDCWPRYVRQWDPLVKSVPGPIAVALWSETFGRDPATWIETATALFQAPPRGGAPLGPERTIAVIQAWDRPGAGFADFAHRVKASGLILALDPIDQSWEPRVVPVP